MLSLKNIESNGVFLFLGGDLNPWSFWIWPEGGIFQSNWISVSVSSPGTSDVNKLIANSGTAKWLNTALTNHMNSVRAATISPNEKCFQLKFNFMFVINCLHAASMIVCIKYILIIALQAVSWCDKSSYSQQSWWVCDLLFICILL